MCFLPDHGLDERRHHRSAGALRRIGASSKIVPTRKRFRHGRRRAFHLYHAWVSGPAGFGDMDGMAGVLSGCCWRTLVDPKLVMLNATFLRRERGSP